MKTIILLRHGKSDWDAGHGSDHERPLAKRGREAAQRMGVLLASVDQVPGLVLTSSAIRARETVERAAEAGNWGCPVEVVPEFYASSPATVLETVRRQDDDVSSLLLAGHEPTWSALASDLMGGGALRFPTAALARIDLEIASWKTASADRGALVWFLIPRLVQAAGFPVG